MANRDASAGEMVRPGQLITVGGHPGVVVESTDLDVPDDHLAIWYGQFTEDGRPRIRTVPECYVTPAAESPELYH